MKKLVLVAALFMLVCGGSFVANAQDPVKTQNPTEQTKDSTSTATPATEEPKAEEPKTDEPKSDEPKSDAPATNAPSTDTPSTDTPTQPAE